MAGDLVTPPMPHAGTCVIGATRTGKSSYLYNRMVADGRAGKGCLLIDPKGAAKVGSLVDLVYAALEREDVTVLDVESANFGINPLVCEDPGDRQAVDDVTDAAMELFVRVFELDPTVTTQLYAYLYNSVVALVVAGGTLAQLPGMLISSEARAAVLAQLPRRDYPLVHAFWHRHENDLTKHDRENLIGSTYVRVLQFFSGERASTIFGSPTNTTDWVGEMAASRVDLVRLSPRLARLSNMVGRVVLTQVAGAVFAREERTPFAIYCDEYHRFATPATDELLTMGGGFGAEVTLANQDFAQLRESTRAAVLQAGNLVVFRVSGDDAAVVAPNFRVPEDEPRIIGRMAVQAVPTNVMSRLLDGKHPDPGVRQLVDGRMRPWRVHHDQWIEEGERWAKYAVLDAYLADMMAGKIVPCTAEEGTRVAEVIGTFMYQDHRAVLAETCRNLTLGKSWEPLASRRTNELAGKERERIAAKRVENKGAHRHYIDPKFLSPDRLAILRSHQPIEGQGHEEWVRKQDKLWAVWWVLEKEQQEENEQRLAEEEAGTWQKAVREAREEFFAEAAWIIDLGRLLAKHPLMVDTDRFEPMYERQRSVADRVGDFANQLIDLGRGQAWVKLWRGEDFLQEKVTFLPPPKANGRRFVPPPRPTRPPEPVAYADEDAAPQPRLPGPPKAGPEPRKDEPPPE